MRIPSQKVGPDCSGKSMEANGFLCKYISHESKWAHDGPMGPIGPMGTWTETARTSGGRKRRAGQAGGTDGTGGPVSHTIIISDLIIKVNEDKVVRSAKKMAIDPCKFS